MERETKGFIFVNEYGLYAREYLSTAGFGQASVGIQWISDIDDAEVFANESVIRRKHADQLKKCQALEAIELKSVRLKLWSKEGEQNGRNDI